LPIETLTDARVPSAAPPKAGILELWDGKTSGLCFRVMKSGLRPTSINGHWEQAGPSMQPVEQDASDPLGYMSVLRASWCRCQAAV
jgi:hypothetical protein